MVIDCKYPYSALQLIKDFPFEKLVSSANGKHPYSAIAVRLRNFEEKFFDFIEYYKDTKHDMDNALILCQKFREFCYASIELIESYYEAFKTIIPPSNKKFSRLFYNLYKSKRRDIALLVNKCKHEHQEIMPVIAENPEKQVCGFVLLESYEFNKQRVNRGFHRNGRATSFRFFLLELIDSIFSIDQQFSKVIKSSGLISDVKPTEQPTSSKIADLLDLVCKLDSFVFPNELLKQAKSLVKSSDSKFKISNNKMLVSFLKGKIRIGSCAMGDGITRTFVNADI